MVRRVCRSAGVSHEVMTAKAAILLALYAITRGLHNAERYVDFGGMSRSAARGENIIKCITYYCVIII